MIIPKDKIAWFYPSYNEEVPDHLPEMKFILGYLTIATYVLMERIKKVEDQYYGPLFELYPNKSLI